MLTDLPSELLTVQETDTELQLRALLDDNPNDFDLWIKYVRNIESQGNVKKSERGYEDLLRSYPLLYGYWCKLAKLDYDDLPRARRIYERALKVLPYCVELWTDYCAFVADKSLNITHVRSLFERATSQIGSDYPSTPLWQQYVEFELSQEAFSNVSKLYDRIFSQPLRGLAQFWERFVEFAANRASVSDLCIHHVEYETATSQASTIDEQKEVIVRWRQKRLEEGLETLKPFEKYERNFTRSFYHPTQPLDRLELHNWRRYLVFIDSLFAGLAPDVEDKVRQSTLRRVESVYERCLVACGNYVEFYRRFALFYERHGFVDRARAILERATVITLKIRPESYIALAEFEEAHGNLDRSLEILTQLVEMPNVGVGCIAALMSLIQFYCRHQRYDDAEQVFVTKRESVPPGQHGRDFFDVQYAYFVRTFRASRTKARTVYQQAVDSAPSSRFARLAQIHFETEHFDFVDEEVEEEEEGGEGEKIKAEVKTETEAEAKTETETEGAVDETSVLASASVGGSGERRLKRRKRRIEDLFESAVGEPTMTLRDRVDLLDRYRDFAILHSDIHRVRQIDEKVLTAVVEENEEDRQRRLKRKRKADGEHPDAPDAKKARVESTQDLIGKFGYNPTL